MKLSSEQAREVVRDFTVKVIKVAGDYNQRLLTAHKNFGLNPEQEEINALLSQFLQDSEPSMNVLRADAAKIFARLAEDDKENRTNLQALIASLDATMRTADMISLSMRTRQGIPPQKN